MVVGCGGLWRVLEGCGRFVGGPQKGRRVADGYGRLSEHFVDGCGGVKCKPLIFFIWCKSLIFFGCKSSVEKNRKCMVRDLRLFCDATYT